MPNDLVSLYNSIGINPKQIREFRQKYAQQQKLFFPLKIVRAKDINFTEKTILADVITSFNHVLPYSYSNQTISKRLKISTKTVGRCLKDLVAKHYIKIRKIKPKSKRVILLHFNKVFDKPNQDLNLNLNGKDDFIYVD